MMEFCALRGFANVDAGFFEFVCELFAEGMVIDFGGVTDTSSEGEVRVVNLVLDGGFQVVGTTVFASDFGTSEFCLVVSHGPDAA